MGAGRKENRRVVWAGWLQGRDGHVVLLGRLAGIYVMVLDGELWEFSSACPVWAPNTKAMRKVIHGIRKDVLAARDDARAQLATAQQQGTLRREDETLLTARLRALESNAAVTGGDNSMAKLLKNIRDVDGIAWTTASDMDPVHKITCADGRTYNLTTGESYLVRPSDRITRLVPHVPTSGDTPVLNRFLLSSSAGDVDLAASKKQLLALMLTGVNHKVGWFLYGPTNSGKSTFLFAARTLLGEGFAAIGAGVFSNEKRALLDMELASAVGKLCVATEESASGSRMRTDLFKQLTGKTSQMQARRVKQDYQTVDVTFQLVMATNYLPIIDPDDEAALNRMMILPFHAAYDDAVFDI